MPGGAEMNVYEIVTNRIIETLEQGVVPWRRPWRVDVPKNFITGKEYRGVNVFLLTSQNYSSPWWLTFKQARNLGGSVRREEHSTPVVFWKWIERSASDEETGETKTVCVPLLRYYRVFNVEQCEGLPEKPAFAAPAKIRPIERAEQIVRRMPNRPSIQHNGGQAAYNPATDTVAMPLRALFRKGEEYYSTLFHELVHSTGHPSRLDRFKKSRPTIGPETYSREELVAEMGAAFLCGHCRIVNETIDNSAAYIRGWLRRIKDDKRLMTFAATEAQKAADFVLKGGSATNAWAIAQPRTVVPAHAQQEDPLIPADRLSVGQHLAGINRTQSNRLVVERHPDSLWRVLWGYKTIRGNSR
jgi:antirestriction protein ArdC